MWETLDWWIKSNSWENILKVEGFYFTCTFLISGSFMLYNKLIFTTSFKRQIEGHMHPILQNSFCQLQYSECLTVSTLKEIHYGWIESNEHQPWIFYPSCLSHGPSLSQHEHLSQRLGQQLCGHCRFCVQLPDGDSHSPYFPGGWLGDERGEQVQHCLDIHLRSCVAVGSVWHLDHPPLTAHEDLNTMQQTGVVISTITETLST